MKDLQKNSACFYLLKRTTLICFKFSVGRKRKRERRERGEGKNGTCVCSEGRATLDVQTPKFIFSSNSIKEEKKHAAALVKQSRGLHKKHGLGQRPPARARGQPSRRFP